METYSLDQVTRVLVPRQLIFDTLAVLQAAGRSGNEALVLWLGAIGKGSATVLAQLAPPQNPIHSEDGVGYFVNSQTLFTLNRFLREHRLRLICQVHSHPGAAYHSSTDDAYAIVTADGGYSLVVPDFGFLGPALEDWAIYRLHGGNWLELGAREVAETFTVT